MPPVRVMPMLALVATVACASHAERLAQNVTRGVKTQTAETGPALAKELADQAARGAVAGALAQLASDEAARDIATALQPAGEQLQQLVERTVDTAVASAVDTLGRRLETDSTLRDQLAAITHQVSASAVYGARDAVADFFPECVGVPDWRQCVKDELGDAARDVTRGVVGGVVRALRWPVLAVVFLSGVLLTLLLVRARSTFGHDRPAHDERARA